MGWLRRISFRSRLVLAMMAVVGGVTAGTLWVTEQRVQAGYDRMFEGRFRSQVEFFRELRGLRMAGVQARCVEFARNVRVRGLLRRVNRSRTESDPADAELAATKLYQTAGDELRSMLEAGASTGDAPGALFYRMLDDRGRVLEPPSALDPAAARGLFVHSLHAKLETTGRTLRHGGARAVARYAALPTEGGDDVLLDLLYVPIPEEESDDMLGALILAFGVLDFGGTDTRLMKAKDRDAALAFWVDGSVFARGFSASDRLALERLLAARTQRGQRREVDLSLALGGTTYRVFAEALGEAAYQICLFSMTEILAERRTIRARILGFGGMGLLGALGLSFLLSHGLSGPIRQLAQATGEVRRGNLNVRVPVEAEDELGKLALSFNEMTEGLAEKERYRHVLSVVTDKAVAEELLAGRIRLGGETRQVSVLFCDIRGFTALTQDMPPEEVIRLLNEHFTPLTSVVYRHRGVVDKFVGDLIMAVFGAPRSYGDDSQYAVNCALEMIEERIRLNRTSRYTIEMGIGIATGTVVAGCMGSDDRLNYTVLGQRVNLASRLCGKAGRMEIVIDQATRDALGPNARIEPLADLTLKGFSEPVAAFRTLSNGQTAVL